LSRFAKPLKPDWLICVNELDTVSATDAQITAARKWCSDLATDLDAAATAVSELLSTYREISRQLDKLVHDMNFGFLYDAQRHVFRIGYNVDAEKPDPNYYDLLASEARSASLLAIAKGDVPARHWLHLGRPLTTDQRPTLPGFVERHHVRVSDARLWTRHYPDTLMEASACAAVEAQIDYVRDKHNVPWGISESGYYRFDANMNYQYRAFGVPGIGFQRGLEDDLVISPYASLLALPLRPQAVLENIRRLRDLGMLGDYGFYEAMDYTTARLALNQEYTIVRSYMVHHHGMILLALVNALDAEPMVRRFHADHRIRSVQLLLHEQIPYDAPLEEMSRAESPAARVTQPEITAAPWPAPVKTPFPPDALSGQWPLWAPHHQRRQRLRPLAGH
jgi:cyclic beta-1,2-glucan synthetase